MRSGSMQTDLLCAESTYLVVTLVSIFNLAPTTVIAEREVPVMGHFSGWWSVTNSGTFSGLRSRRVQGTCVVLRCSSNISVPINKALRIVKESLHPTPAGQKSHY